MIDVDHPDFAPYVGRKSLFHAFRMLDFACQVIEQGKIVNYASCNDIYEEVLSETSVDGMYYKKKYQKRFNAAKSRLRQLAPKPSQQNKRS